MSKGEKTYELALFAGAGGGILGGMLCGHTVVGAVEIEEYPRDVLKQRQRDGILDRFPIWDDVTTFRVDNPECREYIEGLRGVKQSLVISAGWPCQDLSIANPNGKGLDGERSGLWSEVERIISEIRPKNVFLENSAMLAVRGGTRVIEDLAGMGYVGSWGAMGGIEAGLSADGKRIWILAHEAYSERRIAAEIQGAISYSEKPWRRQFERAISACASESEHAELLRDTNVLAGRMGAIKAAGNGQMARLVKLAWELLG